MRAKHMRQMGYMRFKDAATASSLMARSGSIQSALIAKITWRDLAGRGPHSRRPRPALIRLSCPPYGKNWRRGFYHVMARGNRRERIYHDDDRRFFLATLAKACGMTGWRVHAWVLGNHTISSSRRRSRTLWPNEVAPECIHAALQCEASKVGAPVRRRI